MHQAPLEEERPTQLEDIVGEEILEAPLRRPKRIAKPSLRYANATLIEGTTIKEPRTYEEAC